MAIPVLIFLIIGLIYYPFFTNHSLSSGDWPYLFIENIKEFSWLPEIRFLWLSPYYQILTKFAIHFGFSWNVIEKFFWFFPFILLSFFSSYKFTKSIIGALIYSTNTYILMIVGGGQMGVAMSYALAPFVLTKFESPKSVVTGLIFALQIMFDPRIAVLTLIAGVIVYPNYQISRLKRIVASVGVAIVLNFYWIIPLLRSQASIAFQLGEATVDTVKFLSFATFEQTVSLLHPNWPENIFGKVYFMQPEFLLIPIIAFSCLLFTRNSRTGLHFSFLALLGAFLAKGTNPPFGEIYIWLFEHVPGFVLFRDPTKFYLYPAIAFSVLIRLGLEQIEKKKLFSLVFILIWAFTIRQAFIGQLAGTFKPLPIPQEYITFKDFINNQHNAFSTLWIPERQRFGFVSKLHPSFDARQLSKEPSISGILSWLYKDQTRKDIAMQHIKYIIVPYDSRGELFLAERNYDNHIYMETIASVAATAWLSKVSTFSKIGVFEVQP